MEHYFLQNIWIYLTILEFIIICFIVIKKKKRPKQELKEQILGQEIDFKNLINSSFHAGQVWDELRKKCHPDRFGGDEYKVRIANEIQSSINEHKSNIKELMAIKIRAEKELGVKFNI